MKNVTFYLGPAVGLSQRQLTITRFHRAGDDSAPAAAHNADAGSTAESATVALPDGTVFQAKLVDTKTSGEVSDPDILNFQTGDLQFPGPKSGDRLAILSMEDLSSSSSSSSQSSSSSSSQSSSSSESSSSQSSSSSSASSSSSSQSGV